MEPLSSRLIKEWLLADDDDQEAVQHTHNLVSYLSIRLFDDYEPTQFEPFADRLDKWLANVFTDRDRKTLFLLLNHLFFIGRRGFESLCRAAFNGPIARWIIDELDLDFADVLSGHSAWDQAIKETWFCPVTDSMRINAFLKVNRIHGHSYRPDWRSLAQFTDDAKLRDYIAKQSIKRIALLEDFVGSGIQMEPPVEFAAKIDPSLEILCCPFVICPDGVDKGAELMAKHENLTISPIISLTSDMFIRFNPQMNENPFFRLVRSLIANVSSRMTIPSGEQTHGFADTGALVVLYSNCPDNTLPIIHDQTDAWAPLFPRIRRD